MLATWPAPDVEILAGLLERLNADLRHRSAADQDHHATTDQEDLHP